MEVTILDEYGVDAALLGLGLSYGLTSKTQYQDNDFLDNYNRLLGIAQKLSPGDDGHNKFLESMILWIDITAPRFWWQEFDTYRVGVSKQSESTMHTILRRPLNQSDFELPIPDAILSSINDLLTADLPPQSTPSIYSNIRMLEIKNILPEGFLQRRIVSTSYKSLRHIISQRSTHKLPQWHTFISAIYSQCQFPEFLPQSDLSP